jgi:disulfide bond formation protein DsbB
MGGMSMTRERGVAAIAAAGALLALLVALGSERFGGLVPCALCLVERWPYRIAILLGILALLLPRRLARIVLVLAALTFLAGAAAAAVHVGVELGWWKSPLPECAAPHAVQGTFAQRLAAMPARPAKPCDDPTYLIPGLPVSMAAMNLIFALAMTAIVAVGLARPPSLSRSVR